MIVLLHQLNRGDKPTTVGVNVASFWARNDDEHPHQWRNGTNTVVRDISGNMVCVMETVDEIANLVDARRVYSEGDGR